MSRIIYLISVLDKVGSISVVLLILSIVVLFIAGWIYFDTADILDDDEEKCIKGFLKVAGIFFVISLLPTVLIPAKEEMYMMALTKNYQVEDVYRMTKDEIKGSIDYVFDRIKELESE